MVVAAAPHTLALLGWFLWQLRDHLDLFIVRQADRRMGPKFQRCRGALFRWNRRDLRDPRGLSCKRRLGSQPPRRSLRPQRGREPHSLYDLLSSSGLPALPIDHGIRTYVSAVVEKEWPAMARGEAAPEADSAQDRLLDAVADLEAEPNSSPAITRVMLDTALKIRDARYERLLLSADYSEGFKWMSVLVIALVGQISVAVVHLERARPHIAAMVIFTSGIVIVLGLIASHQFPFSSALSVSPEPIAEVLMLVPNG